ncbi:MAG TPA: M28 family peptidase [Gemmatimonadaceae bacterium]|nr:M28 family peptidase [Gemmatimonadaceae bacterium]
MRPVLLARRAGRLAAPLLAVAPLAVAACAGAPSAASPHGGELPRTHAPRPTAAAITPQDLMTRLYVFADDSMQGRAMGTAGYRRATDYIAAELRRLGLQPAGGDGSYFQNLPARLLGVDDTSAPGAADGAGGTVRTVVAIIPGRDPALRGQYVALGAHADHLGVSTRPVDHDSLRAVNALAWQLSGATNDPRPLTAEERAQLHVDLDSLRRLRPVRLDSTYNGADDDGTGSMALLEIAEALARGPARPRRSVLLVWHTGEELGMLGSAYFTDHPTVPLDSIVAQINVDMIGRGSAADLVNGGPGYVGVVGASRLSTELGELVERVNAEGDHGLTFDYALDAAGHPQNIYCRSDHYSYARHGIPIAFFFTGLHGDYHQVTDEPQYIDYPHYARITRYLQDLVLAVADRPSRLVVDQPKPDPNGRCQQ